MGADERRAGRQSKIEQLPEDLKERINELLADGSWTYQGIIDALKDQLPRDVHLTRQNLSGYWRKRVRPMLENRAAMREAFALEEELDKEGQVDMARLLNNKLMLVAAQIAQKLEEQVTQANIDGDLVIDEELTECVEGLVRTLKGLEQAGRVNQQREQYIATQAAEKAKKQAAKVIDQAVKSDIKGLSKEAANAIKRGILGI